MRLKKYGRRYASYWTLQVYMRHGIAASYVCLANNNLLLFRKLGSSGAKIVDSE